MIVSDDAMFAAEAERAMTIHLDGVRRLAFLGRVDRLDGSNKAVAR